MKQFDAMKTTCRYFHTNRKKLEVCVRAGFSSGVVEIWGVVVVGGVVGGRTSETVWLLPHSELKSTQERSCHVHPAGRQKQGGRHLPSLCVTSASVAFTVPARPAPTHPRTPTTDLGTAYMGEGGQHGEPSQGCKFPIVVQMKILWVGVEEGVTDFLCSRPLKQSDPPHVHTRVTPPLLPFLPPSVPR